MLTLSEVVRPLRCGNRQTSSPGLSRLPSTLFDLDDVLQTTAKHEYAAVDAPGVRVGLRLGETSSSGAAVRQATEVPRAIRHLKSIAAQHEAGLGCGNAHSCERVLVELGNAIADAGFEVQLVQDRSCHSRRLRVPMAPFKPWLLISGYASGIGKHLEMHVIIDLNFRSKFEICHPSPFFASTLAALPNIFVGEAQELDAIVGRVCTLMQREFNEKSMALPPWRSSPSVLSIWFPQDGRPCKAVKPTALSPENASSPSSSSQELE